MRVLVTGGTGYLGRVLVRRYAREGHEVHGTWHRELPAPQPSVTWHGGDLRDLEATRQFVLRLQPDLVVHTAYTNEADELHRVNAEAPRVIAEASGAVGARLVHLSTDVVFDGTKATGAYRESDPVSPATAYGQSKAEAEAAVLGECPGGLAVRTSLIYGGAEPGPQERLVVRALDGDAPDLKFFVDELRSPVQVDDLAAAVHELAAQSVAGVLHVAGAEVVNRHELAWLLATSWGDAGADDLGTASSASVSPDRPRNCALDSSKAQALLSTRLRGAREVLAI